MARRTHRKKIVTKYSRININVLKRGKIGFGVLAVLAVIGVFSVALVFGLQQLSPYTSSELANYLCCDTGDGDLCKPRFDRTIQVRFRNKSNIMKDYSLLKSNVKFSKDFFHIDPLPESDVLGLEPGQYVYQNGASENEIAQRLYISGDVPEKTCDHFHVPRVDPMDTIHATLYDLDDETNEICEAIPDDELIYVCTKGCEENQQVGDNGVFSVYFRNEDYPTPGIPQTIKNCVKPPEAQSIGSGQEIINLPSPSDKPNLQLETFYVKQDAVVGNWIAPYCKPAIYLYPDSASFINVKINPLGKILITIPEYPILGWNVIAFPSGDIYHQNTHFDYLFYEASIPDDKIVLPDEGFVIPYSNLNNFLPSLVKKLGLNEKETNQFTEYWLKVLPKSRYYQIKIVEQSVLGYISPLNITPIPNSVIRVSLHFTPLEEEISIIEPKIISPIRNGFTVVEWGGIFKKDAAHPFSCFM